MFFLDLRIALLSATFMLCQTIFSQVNDSTEYQLLTPEHPQIISGVLNKSVNDHCVNATLLTVGANEVCMNTSANTMQVGETTCSGCPGGSTQMSLWYFFQATSSESTVTIRRTVNSTICGTDVAVFGPYASEAAADVACMPGTGNRLKCITDFDWYDPIYSFSFNSVAGSYYQIQIRHCRCSGAGQNDYVGCIQIDDTPQNNRPAGAFGIDECGVSVSGTNIGYSPSNGLPGYENLDNNTATTCATCTPGDDVSYVVNNDSWFYFCASATGTWSVNFSGISNCINNNGLQMTIFKGSPSSLTPIWNATSPSAPGSSQNSPAFTLNTGECAYLIVDGFAGDQCNYTYTLNTVASPCSLVPLGSELADFTVVNINGENYLHWKTESEFNTSHFTVERSIDGKGWNLLKVIEAASMSSETISYTVRDKGYKPVINYYRLSQYDLDGTLSWTEIKAIDNYDKSAQLLYSTNLLGQRIDGNYHGMVIDLYSDGTSVHRYQK